jgi:type IV pilus assembly protein PilQ
MMMRSLSLALVPMLIGLGSAPVPHAREGQVTALALSNITGTARLAVSVSGPVQVHDMVLHDPDRIVLDLTGATLGGLGSYDGMPRGIVRDVRINQFKDNVVRVVLEVDRLPQYRIDQQTPGEVAVVFSDQPFVSWGSDASTGLRLAVLPATDTFTPGRMLAAPPLRATPAPSAAARQQQQLLDFQFNDAPINDALNQFAAYSGRSIVPGKDVTGNVTMTIHNATWEDAFHAFLDAQGLSATEMAGGIIRVDNPSELGKLDSIEVLQPVIVPLNYAKAAEVAQSIRGLLTRNRGTVEPDTSTNSLVINDTRTRIRAIEDFVKQLDVKTPTIAISAKLIFVDRTDLEQMGVKYDIGTSSQFFNQLVQRIDPLTGQPYQPTVNVVNLGGNAVSAISNANALISNSALDLVFSTAIGGFSVTSFLSALSQTELSDVEAQPTIHTLDNKQAQIVSGEQTPVRVIDLSSLGQGTAVPRANVQFKETGIKLTATPHVTANRQIVMDLDVERSSIQPLAAADLGYTIPIQHSTDKLLVNDGETAVIGGMTVTTVTKNRQGIPLLSSLPFVGHLFSYTTDQEERQDLIILVTPRIVDDPAVTN